MSIFFSLNLVTIIGFMNILFHKIFIVNWSRIYLLMLGLVVIGVNSYIIFGGNRYRDIENRYSKEDSSTKVKSKIYVLIYILATIGLLVTVLFLLRHNPIIKNNNISYNVVGIL